MDDEAKIIDVLEFKRKLPFSKIPRVLFSKSPSTRRAFSLFTFKFVGFKDVSNENNYC